MATMLYQGHGSFRFVLDDGTVAYVDPFAGEGYDLPADVIFITHEHPDHVMTWRIPNGDTAPTYRAADFLADDTHQTITTCGITATAVEACNANHPIDACVGIVFAFDGITFYAAGDTSTTDAMRAGTLAALNLDYCTLPGDGFYNMGPEEASECARLIKAKHTIPVHLVPVHDVNDATIFDRATAEAFDVEGRIILEPGDELTL